jgi:hypothetical protein
MVLNLSCIGLQPSLPLKPDTGQNALIHSIILYAGKAIPFTFNETVELERSALFGLMSPFFDVILLP